MIAGLIGWGLLMALLLPLMVRGDLDRIEYRGLDWLQRNFVRPERISPDIVIFYIDQKSIDFFQRTSKIGWPWPRDAYALVVGFLKAAGARAAVFDAYFSEPSVFAETYGDDQNFARAMSASGRVFQTLVFHEKPKGGAPTDEAALASLADRALDYDRRAGPEPAVFQDVTLPLEVLEKASWGLGFINFEPEADGVMRRLRPLALFRDQVFPALSLAVYLKLTGRARVVQSGAGLQAGQAVMPLDDEGKTLIKYYGGLGVYPSFTIAAVIQSAMQLENGRKPMLDPALFRDKIVFVGAKAAALYDLRSTPLAEATPGVEIQATCLNNLLAQDFLKRAPFYWRGLLVALLLLATLGAAILTRSVLSGAGLSLGLGAVYLAAVILAFSHDFWLDLISPLGGQAAVFILAGLINYYGEGREKSAVRGAFSRYLSPDVVSQVLENPELLSLGGSRRVMTVFFSDLAGFTTISEKISPEELVRLLNRYLSLMTEVIMDHGGTVDKFEGDAIMAFWGAPLFQEDHARRACLAALDQQTVMNSLRAEVAAEGLPELRVRMGLNTGPMIVGNMGSEQRFDYTVMGDAVNLASRLEGANKAFGSEIMISESTYEEVRGLVEARELDLLRVKGKEQPIRVYELMARAGELGGERAAVRKAFEEGLSLYRQARFDSALESFQRALSIDPGDKPSKTYLERCRAFKDKPPPPDWDGVFTLAVK